MSNKIVSKILPMMDQDETNDKEKKMTKTEQNNVDTVQKHHERKEDNEKSRTKKSTLFWILLKL